MLAVRAFQPVFAVSYALAAATVSDLTPPFVSFQALFTPPQIVSTIHCILHAAYNFCDVR